MRLFKKIISFGIRRALIRFNIFLICKLKVIAYRYVFSDNSPCIIGSQIIQPTQFIGKGVIEVIETSLGAWPSAGLLDRSGYIEARSASARVKISSSTAINNSFVIIADKTSISIGCDCLIGPNFFISDSDFHGISISDRRGGKQECKPVIIEDNVFIGENVRAYVSLCRCSC
jgi:maltose O-acetyltransferase